MADPADRLTAALATLKSDLIALRHQDVQLMKQMIVINDTIQRMTKRNKRLKRESPLTAEHIVKTDTNQTAKTPLVRVQSTPDFCGGRNFDRCESVSSYEGDVFSSLEDIYSTCSEYTDTEEDWESPVPFTSLTAVRRRSVEEHVTDIVNADSYYEDILKKNIKLWKDSKTISNETLSSISGSDSDFAVKERDLCLYKS